MLGGGSSVCVLSSSVIPSLPSSLPSPPPSLLYRHRYNYVLLLSATNSRFSLLPRRRKGSSTLIPNDQRHSTSSSTFSSIIMASTGENTTSNDVVATSVPVRVAHELLQAGHLYLDVRTPEEFSAGHAVGAINIPYLFRVGSGMTKNPNFLDEVSSHFRKDDEIIVGCQSGKRSLKAVNDLLSAGFTGVTDVAGGFAAWSQNKLPVES